MSANEEGRSKIRQRFDGVDEREVLKRTLPDHLQPFLDIVIIGINPGLTAAYQGHHYAGPGNHFWKCLYRSGLVSEPFTAFDDYRMLQFGIGFTNVVARTTRGSGDLKTAEIREGAAILRQKLQYFRPKIAVFNGKGIFEVYSGEKCTILGKQVNTIEGTNTVVYVMPSSSARCAQLPRLEDKLPFFVGLAKLRHFMNGKLPVLNLDEVTFPCLRKIKKEIKEEINEAEDESTDGGCISVA